MVVTAALPTSEIGGDAGAHRRAVDMHGAGAAEAAAAAEFGAFQIDGVAQDPEQRRVVIDIDRVGLAVHIQRVLHHRPRFARKSSGGAAEP